MTASRNGNEARGIVQLGKSELRKFFADPLGYAVDRWIQALFLSFALMILISAMRLLFEPILKALS